ncbi:Uncharacterised protein [Mycobacteroides abscessus subsp. abscessus]|nr:Uncharacterised protein [Mycobacteroides abscessus subsp. abscessus]
MKIWMRLSFFQKSPNNSLFYELQEFIRLVKSGVTESDINTFQNSMQVMNLLDEARRQMGVVYPADI